MAFKPGAVPRIDAQGHLPDDLLDVLVDDLAALGLGGEGGASPASTITVVQHGANAATARPSGAVAVYWIGTVTPTNMTSADIYNGPTP